MRGHALALSASHHSVCTSPHAPHAPHVEWVATRAPMRCPTPHAPNVEWVAAHTPMHCLAESIGASTPDCNCAPPPNYNCTSRFFFSWLSHARGAWSVGMNALSRNRYFDEKLPSNSSFKCLSKYSHLVFHPKVENENDPLECTQDIEILSKSGKI
jgi:hypothetical protein